MVADCYFSMSSWLIVIFLTQSGCFIIFSNPFVSGSKPLWLLCFVNFLNHCGWLFVVFVCQLRFTPFASMLSTWIFMYSNSYCVLTALMYMLEIQHYSKYWHELNNVDNTIEYLKLCEEHVLWYPHDYSIAYYYR